jgi:hypothetical protein
MVRIISATCTSFPYFFANFLLIVLNKKLAYVHPSVAYVRPSVSVFLLHLSLKILTPLSICQSCLAEYIKSSRDM